MSSETAGWLALILLSLGAPLWGFAVGLRDDVKATKGQRRNPVATKQRSQSRSTSKIRGGYLKWALVATGVMLTAGIGAGLIAVDAYDAMGSSRPASARKLIYLIAWAIWVYASGRLWVQYVKARDSD